MKILVGNFARVGNPVLVLLLGLLFATSSSAQNHTVLFKTTDPGVTKSIATWGMDTTWASADNMRDGMIFMGSNQVDVIRVGFVVKDALTNGQLSASAKSDLDAEKSVANMAGNQPWMFSPTTAAGVNAWFKNGSDVISANWVQAMDAAKIYLGKTNILWAEPFNEPDYAGWNEGPSTDLYNIMGLLQTDTNFSSTLLAGGSPLNVDNAVGWYDAVKGRAAIGTTHCLGGSFASYVNWMQDVRNSGGFCLNPEVHNLVEVIAGAQYGLQGGIWWGGVNLPRGLFVQSCQGQRLGYAEDQGQWTAAAVYRGPDGAVRGFVGSSERQGTTTSYQFLCQDRDVWFNGVGPQRGSTVTIPQNGEAYVDVTWGADIPPPIYGKYVLVARHSGKVMEVAGASLSDGANVQQNTYNGGNNQMWDIMPDAAGDGFYTIKNANSGKTAEDYNWSTTSGNIDQWGAGGNANQYWFFQYVGNGYYSVRNRYSGLYLDVAGVSTADGANIDQSSGTGGLNQQWRLLPTGNWTKVDDNSASVAYSANWGVYLGNPGYQGTEHDGLTTNGTATYTFTGNQARYYGFLRSDLGIATIYVDGVSNATVDCYSATAAFNQLLYQTPMLATGTHTLTVQVFGNKNSASSSFAIIVDAFESFVSTPVNFATPTAPIGLMATANPVSVNLNWQRNLQPDLAGYSIFRSTNSGGPYDTIAMGVTATNFSDKAANQATPYYYVIKAVNDSSGQSPYSAQASATPSGAPSLVAQYEMDGNLADSSGNGNDGVLTGTPVYAAGKFGSAISLNGTNNFVSLPAGMVNFNALSVSAWVYWNGGANWQRIFDFGNDTGHNLFLTPQSSANTLRFGIQNGGAEQDLNTTVLPSNQWVHVAVTLGGNTGKLYVNGQLQDTESITITPSNFNPVNVWIGKSEFSDPFLSGRVDDFRVYNYALSGAQITSLFTNVIPSAPTGLTATPGGNVIYLNWTASAGATNYFVKRATVSGGTYATVASTAGTNYLDTGLINGQTYYYVVSAVGPAGESANSSEVSATPATISATLRTTDGSGTSSITGATNWNPTGVPVPGNTYHTGPFALRTPPDAGSYVFAGDSLTIDVGGRLLLKGAGGTQVITVNHLLLNGGLADFANTSADNLSTILAGNITLAPGTTNYLGALSGSGSETLVITAPISGGGQVQVAGPNVNAGADNGTVILAGASTYTGKTTVSGGTLQINGSLTSTASVSVTGLSGLKATLGGNGIIAPGTGGQIVVGVNGMLAPGASALGTLTVDGGATAANVLSLNPGAQWQCRLDAGQQSDRLRLVNSAAGDMVFSGNTINFNDLSGGALTAGTYTFMSADADGAYAGLTLDGGNNITGGLSIGTGLGAYPGAQLKVIGNNLVLQITTNTAAATATQITVNYGVDKGPAMQVASGFLHGIGPLSPSQYLIDGVKVTSIRGADLSNPGAYLPALFDPATHARVMQAGNPALIVGLYYEHGSYWPGEGGDNFSQWQTEVSGVYNNALTNNYQVYAWIPWNEPDLQWTGSHTTAGYYATLQSAYQTIKALNPNARIEAPEISAYNFSYLTNFLNFCKVGNCVPDVISWHELPSGNAPDIEAHTAQLQAWLQANGFGTKPFAITEYQGGSYGGADAYNPAIATVYLAKLERSVTNGLLFGLKSAWNQTGNDPAFKAALGDTADAATASFPRGNWWAYNAYKDMTGRMVQTTTTGSSLVDALAGADSVMNRSVILIGNESTSAQAITLVLTNLAQASFLTRNGKVHVRLETYGTNNVVYRPTLLLAGDYAVVNNSLVLNLPPLATQNGGRLYLSSATQDAPTTVYEAENLPFSTSSGDSASVISPAGASGGQAVMLTANSVGDVINFAINVPATAVYDLSGQLVAAPANAMIQLYVNGQAYGGPQDEYGANTSVYQASFGKIALLAGTNTLSFSVVNKNPLDTAADFEAGFDNFSLTQINVIQARPGTTPDRSKLTLTFDRFADPTLTYEVSAIDDLTTGNWNVIWTSTGAQNVSGSVTVTDTVLTSSQPRRFLRLRILK